MLRSAIANAQQKDGFGGDVDRLFVSACYAEPGAVAEARPPGADGPRVPRREAHRAPDGRSVAGKGVAGTMGQKVHPYGFRLGFNKTWRSRWFADRDYAKLLHEDLDAARRT